MATKRRRENDAEKELKELKRSIVKRNRERRRALTKAQKELLLCLKDCLKKLNDPPWHYGPRCNHP